MHQSKTEVWGLELLKKAKQEYDSIVKFFERITFLALLPNDNVYIKLLGHFNNTESSINIFFALSKSSFFILPIKSEISNNISPALPLFSGSILGSIIKILFSETTFGTKAY